MLMTSIRDYVQLKGRVELQDIARHFRLPESALMPILNFWVKKKVIQLIVVEQPDFCQSKKCDNSAGCNFANKTIYAWI